MILRVPLTTTPQKDELILSGEGFDVFLLRSAYQLLQTEISTITSNLIHLTFKLLWKIQIYI